MPKFVGPTFFLRNMQSSHLDVKTNPWLSHYPCSKQKSEQERNGDSGHEQKGKKKFCNRILLNQFNSVTPMFPEGSRNCPVSSFKERTYNF